MSELPSHETNSQSTRTTSNNNGEDYRSTRENGNALGGSLNASVSSLASSSGASVKSGIPKPKLIKLASSAENATTGQSASRIGRLCGNQPKPAIPSSPVKSSEFCLRVLFSFQCFEIRGSVKRIYSKWH